MYKSLQDEDDVVIINLLHEIDPYVEVLWGGNLSRSTITFLRGGASEEVNFEFEVAFPFDPGLLLYNEYNNHHDNNHYDGTLNATMTNINVSQ